MKEDKRVFDKDQVRRNTDLITEELDRQAIENIKTLQRKRNYEEELIAPGFYYILASDDGTSLSKLAENPDDYKVKPEDLKNYSVYINADGSLSNAYVDTGLFDNNSVGLGGFSGGSVK